ncbi:MAG: ABC transporter ATP-binding protein [Nitrospirae bacterium]|jgi:ABC-type polysaccharide/polyol phosphate transport system ATPase subunit|nr:ABC transporter ATP-binding protein [Nitrospirota bacterium]
MGMPVIDLKNISVKYRLAKDKPKTLQEYIIRRIKFKKIEYNDFWALKGISLEFTKGKATGIIGKNGAGKSTLLKVIAGVLKPVSGKISINGKIAPLIELNAGFDRELTGIENIFLNASLLGYTRKEIKRCIDKIIEFSELEEFIYSPLRSYSSGMISRLGFSIATELNPDILIIDEALAVGDEHFKRKCKERILNFKNKGATILFVSHDMDEIIEICDNVLWLEQGRIYIHDTPKIVVGEYLKHGKCQ